METITDRINQIIKTKNIKRADFSRALGLSAPSITNICNGKTSPSAYTISQICTIYHVNQKWLEFGEGDMFTPLSKEETIAAIVAKLYECDEDSFIFQFMKHVSELDYEEMLILKRGIDILSKSKL